MNFLSIASLVISIGVPLGIFVGRRWIIVFVSKSVEHRFNLKIEAVRSELRKSEEGFLSDLRRKEAEFVALRESILGGSANRQSLLDTRRFEAVEKVWTAVNDLARLKTLAAVMSRLNFKAMAEDINDPRMQKFLEFIEKQHLI